MPTSVAWHIASDYSYFIVTKRFNCELTDLLPALLKIQKKKGLVEDISNAQAPAWLKKWKIIFYDFCMDVADADFFLHLYFLKWY